MPATLTTASSRMATTVAARSRGSTSRWSGLTPITSMALISSRMRREPRSAHMADPPAPAISSAVATGACSRTTASTMAAPSCDCAPICCRSEPTSSAMTMPKGMDSRIRGSVVTRARNQHWSKNSEMGTPLSGACRSASNAVANMLPVSRTAVATLPSSVMGRLGRGSTPAPPGRPLGVPSRRAISARLRGWVGLGRLARERRRPVPRLSQRRPPFRGLLRHVNGSRQPAPPSNSFTRKTAIGLQPCGAACLEPRTPGR